MANKWLQTQLKDHVDLLVGFAFKSADFTEGPKGVRLLRGDNVTEGHLRWGEKTRYWLEVNDELRRYLLRPGDVVIGMDGSRVGRNWAQIRDSDVPLLLVQRVACLRARATLDQSYLPALIGSERFRQHVNAYKTGSSIPHISGEQICAFDFEIPPLSEQRAIAHILGALDEKIELNRQMNETLEAMARALFKSWFIDFDPVRNKAGGGFPNLPTQIADLYPDRLVNTNMGVSPDGWTVKRWGDLATLEYGKSLGDYKEVGGEYPVYGTNGRIGTCDKALCPHAGIIVGRKGAYRGIHYCSSPFFVIDTAFFLKPRVPLEMRWAYYELLRNDLNSMDSGSAIPSTSREDFYALPVIAPPVAVQKAFVEMLDPFWLRQEQSEDESHTVAALRDTLLPKLISGEIRVKDAEKMAEAVA